MQVCEPAWTFQTGEGCYEAVEATESPDCFKKQTKNQNSDKTFQLKHLTPVENKQRDNENDQELIQEEEQSFLDPTFLDSGACFCLCSSSESSAGARTRTYARTHTGSLPSSVTKEGRLLSNKCKGVMASHRLLPEINTELLWCLTLTEKSPHLQMWARHNPFSIPYPPISNSKLNSSAPPPFPTLGLFINVFSSGVFSPLKPRSACSSVEELERLYWRLELFCRPQRPGPTSVQAGPGLDVCRTWASVTAVSRHTSAQKGPN